jgi:Sodium/hydrogen exchanger family
VLILAAVILLAVKVLPRLGVWTKRVRDRELRVIGAIAAGFATAALTQTIGLLLPLSAFMGGLVAGSFESAEEVAARLIPLRNACLALFLVTIGALVDPYRLIANPSPLIVALLLIVLGKTLIWTVLVRLLRNPLWSAAFAAIGLSQIGEFSYVLVRAAYETGVVESEIYNGVLGALVLTIPLSFLLQNIARSRGSLGGQRVLLLMAALVARNLGDVVSEFIGVASSFHLFGVSRFISVPSAAAFVWLMIVFGVYKRLEKIFVFLSFLYIAYVVAGILARPSWLEVSRHLVRIPSLQELRQPGYLYLSVGWRNMCEVPSI